MSSGSGRGRRDVVVGLFVLACVAAVVTVFVARVEFPHGTTDLDEVAYTAQADAIAHHELTLPVATHDPFFRPFLSGVRGDRVVFKYQPVWPAMIAVSDGLFGSTLPLRVLMSVAGMLATAWFAWELTRDARVALVAAGLVVASPFTWMQTASLLGYQLSFVLATACAAALVRTIRAPTRVGGIAAGALLGLAVLHRPFDALLATAPVLVYWGWCAWRRRQLLRSLIPIGLGGLPFLAVFVAYNRSVMSSVTHLAYNVGGRSDTFGFGWRSSFVAPGNGHEVQIHYTVARAFSTFAHLFVALPRFVAFAPVVIVLAGACLVVRRRDARTWLLVAMVVAVVVGYFFWWGVANSYAFDLDRSLGPFYYYPVLAPLGVLAAWGAVSVRRWTIFRIAAMTAVGLVWAVGAAAIVVTDGRDAGDVRTSEVRSLRSPVPALVLEAPLFANDPYLRVATDVSLRAAHLVAVDVRGRRLELVDRFPGRTPFLMRSYHRFGDAFGAEQHDRVELRVTRASEITAHVRVSLAAGQAGTVYVRIGDGAPQVSRSGRGEFDVSLRLSAAAFVSHRGATTTVAIGVTQAPGADAPTRLTDNWIECSSEARVTKEGVIELLQPCDGRHHYAFPGGSSVSASEDVSPVLQVSFSAG